MRKLIDQCGETNEILSTKSPPALLSTEYIHFIKGIPAHNARIANGFYVNDKWFTVNFASNGLRVWEAQSQEKCEIILLFSSNIS